jgi:hypothetical protein
MKRTSARASAIVVLILGSACGRCGGCAESASGKVLGRAFTPVETAAVISTVATCDFSGGLLQVANLTLAFRDAAGLCVSAEKPCVGRPSARTVAVLLQAQGTSEPKPIGPGRYDVVLDGAGLRPNANGMVVYGFGFAIGTDSTCAEATEPAQASGTVVVMVVTAGSVRGQVDLTFSDGGKLAGPFEATVCGTHPTACELMSASCEGPRSCQ